MEQATNFAPHPMIRLQAVHKTFTAKGGDVKALEDVSLDIQKGEIFGIIGMSGAGKSTLVRCINLLERPTSGQVLLDGIDLCWQSKKDLLITRRSIGMIFQQFNLLMQKNVLDNVRFPLTIAGMPKTASIQRAEELLALVGLSDKIHSYPSQLSGGQKQRVAIARALATNPKVLLCDEATSALDPDTTRAVLALLKDINQTLGITVVIITHEMRVVEEICHRVAILDEGRIAEVSDVAQVFARPKSDIAKKLIYPSQKYTHATWGETCCRIVFDGLSSMEPVIANMVLHCNAPVNIMFADTKDIDGKAYGQIVVQLPQEEDLCTKMFAYLQSLGLAYEEVNINGI